jgi:hypothetical protein
MRKCELSAVICHIGDAEHGHYIALVRGDDDRWFCCDDELVTPFELANLGPMAFGLSDSEPQDIEDVRTGYLLFDRQAGGRQTPPPLPEDLRIEIDRANERIWPSVFFFSGQFLDFAKALVHQFPRPRSSRSPCSSASPSSAKPPRENGQN